MSDRDQSEIVYLMSCAHSIYYIVIEDMSCNIPLVQEQSTCQELQEHSNKKIINSDWVLKRIALIVLIQEEQSNTKQAPSVWLLSEERQFFS